VGALRTKGTFKTGAGSKADFTYSGNAPIAAELAKHLVRVSMSTAIEIGLQYENDTFAYCFTTEDSDEGRAAFAEKRTPKFKGR
jgi:enoyl-CoA hydratase/carnithine racemase